MLAERGVDGEGDTQVTGVREKGAVVLPVLPAEFVLVIPERPGVGGVTTDVEVGGGVAPEEMPVDHVPLVEPRADELDLQVGEPLEVGIHPGAPVRGLLVGGIDRRSGSALYVLRDIEDYALRGPRQVQLVVAAGEGLVAAREHGARPEGKEAPVGLADGGAGDAPSRPGAADVKCYLRQEPLHGDGGAPAAPGRVLEASRHGDATGYDARRAVGEGRQGPDEGLKVHLLRGEERTHVAHVHQGVDHIGAAAVEPKGHGPEARGQVLGVVEVAAAVDAKADGAHPGLNVRDPREAALSVRGGAPALLDTDAEKTVSLGGGKLW